MTYKTYEVNSENQKKSIKNEDSSNQNVTIINQLSAEKHDNKNIWTFEEALKVIGKV